MSRRKKFKKADYEKGRLAEKWIYIFLKRKGYNFKWLNEKKDQYMSYDFVIYNKDKIIAAIECEWKDVYNKKFFDEGVDFIANKIHSNSEKRIPVYYFLVMGDGSEIYKAKMKTLKEKGYFFTKNTKDTENEEFCRVSVKDVNIIDLRSMLYD